MLNLLFADETRFAKKVLNANLRLFIIVGATINDYDDTHEMCICSVIKEWKSARISINHLFPFVFCATNWKAPVELNDLRYILFFFQKNE